MNDFWIGTEMEGRFTGLRTLFIKGDQNLSDIVKILNSYKVISHLYFGAGHQYPVFRYNRMMELVDKGYVITFEISNECLQFVPHHIIKCKQIHMIVTFKNKNVALLKPTDTIKVEDRTNVYATSLCTMYHTDKNVAYEGDVVIK